MLAGTLGGLTAGVITAPLISDGFGVDGSGIVAVIAVVVGWAVAWNVARRIRRYS